MAIAIVLNDDNISSVFWMFVCIMKIYIQIQAVGLLLYLSLISIPRRHSVH